MAAFDNDLAAVIAAWAWLPEQSRTDIAAIVAAAGSVRATGF